MTNRGRSAVPLVSVIVPAYNHEAYLAQALDSIRDEGYPNTEIVLLDDGSTDHTWEVAVRWQKENAYRCVMTASHQPNAGLTATLNRLLALSRGTYVTMLASDDRLLPGGIAARVALLEQNPSLVAVFGDARVIDAAGRVVGQHALEAGYKGVRKRLLRDTAREIVEHWAVPGPVLLYRREPVIALGGYSEDLALEDWDLYLRLASMDAIAYIDRSVADYRWHGANTVADPTIAPRLSDELSMVAWRSRLLFRGHLRMELIHESAALAARSARLRKSWIKWLFWKATSLMLKVVAACIPRRPSDQIGRRGRFEHEGGI